MLPVRTSSLRQSFLVESLIIFFKHTSSLRESISVESLVYFSSILASQIYFSQVSCLFFEPASSLRESILVESLVYFSSLHPRFASLFQSSLLSIFQAYILASRVYFSRVSCLFFDPTSLLRESILIQLTPLDPGRHADIESHLNH